MSVGTVKPSEMFEYVWFEFEGQQYWSHIPHSMGTTKPSSYLRIVDGKLYQWWPCDEVVDVTGIWIKVPEFNTSNETK